MFSDWITYISLGYLCGSLSGAYIFCKIFSLGNPLLSGSGNPGATNVYRMGGWQPATLTLLFDTGKAAFPVYLANQHPSSSLLVEVVALSAITGHLLPIFHSFKGGKGVACALGAGLIMAPLSTCILTIIWVIMIKLFHKSSIASLTVALTAPILIYQLSPAYTLFYIALSMIIVMRHRSNLIKLFHHQEKSL